MQVSSSNSYPGRLRLRFSQLKRQPLFAAQVAAAIRGLDGVLSADANAVTGGLLIVYDVNHADKAGLWPTLRAVLAEHGLNEAERQRTVHAPAARTSTADSVADKLVGTVVDKLVERSALALVAALF